MRVTMIASTAFWAPEHVPWEPEHSDRFAAGQHLAEFAGRACYQSWSKPNPTTATNRGYLANILRQEHYSVLEHASVTFLVEGASRSLTHELIRHRHLSYSQLSQRFVDESDAEFVAPPLIRENEYLMGIFASEMDTVRQAYESFAALIADEFPDATRKQVREAARSVLPNATETKIVVTGNYRAWREFIAKRATEAADAEIRGLATAILHQLWAVAPNVFQDMALRTLDDGSEVLEWQASGEDE